MDFIKALFGEKQQRKIASSDFDNIISYTKSIVVRDDLIQTILQNYQQAQQLPADKKLTAYIQIYIALEQFITTNKPLVVQRILSKDELREEIQMKFAIANLPIEFRVLFLPEKEQYIYLFEKYTQSLAAFIVNQTGPNKVQEIIAMIPNKPSVIPPLSSATGIEFSPLEQGLEKAQISDLKAYFKVLAASLFKEIQNSFGAKSAIDITEKEYAAIKEMYDYDLISKYLTIAPQGILDRERIAFMARDELEKQAIGGVEEKVRRELAEKAAKDLLIAVEERTRELNAEKEELKKNDAKLLASIRSLPLGVVLTNDTDEIIALNEVAKEILGIESTVKNIVELSTIITNKINFKGGIDQSRNEKILKEFKDLEFSNKILNITFTPIFLTSTNETYIGTVILLNDITEAKMLERSKDEFFAIASHELRTPLTAIRGYLSLIDTNFRKDIQSEEVLRMLANIDASSKNLIDIVNEFLDMSRLEQGRIEFNPQTFALTELVSEVINDVGALAEKKQTFLRYENPDTKVPDVHADREKTKQIISNLVGNAIKFTDQGGVSISLEQKANHVCVKVKDSGKGISSETQKLLFKKFQKGATDPLAKDPQRGSGLGLYISKKLAQNMGGDVSLENSEELKGSTFVVTIPITTA